MTGKRKRKVSFWRRSYTPFLGQKEKSGKPPKANFQGSHWKLQMQQRKWWWSGLFFYEKEQISDIIIINSQWNALVQWSNAAQSTVNKFSIQIHLSVLSGMNRWKSRKVESFSKRKNVHGEGEWMGRMVQDGTWKDCKGHVPALLQQLESGTESPSDKARA